MGMGIPMGIPIPTATLQCEHDLGKFYFYTISHKIACGKPQRPKIILGSSTIPVSTDHYHVNIHPSIQELLFSDRLWSAIRARSFKDLS